MEHADGITPRRRRVRPLPYVLLVPATAILGLMLGYPILRLVTLSLQKFGLKQQFGAAADWVGLKNFRSIFADAEFWMVLRRTVVFCAVNVILTMVLGLAIAVLLKRLGSRMRLLVTLGLMLAWSMPALASTVIWQWIFDTQYGIANWVLGRQGESWLSNPLTFYFVATIIVVWMGIPFIAFTLYAGLTQIPDEMMEAASIDGARPWQRFRDIVIPSLKPLLLILTSLSVLWDFRVFTQVYVLQRAGGITRDTNLLGVYAYRTSFGGNHFDKGAAIAIVMVTITVLLTVFYLRSMTKQEEL
ncbi:MAG: sugar transporter permease [Ilumatobacteraceae bacterium]|nr:sugar transporter permease [Ilumatobacteraceae bacterium]